MIHIAPKSEIQYLVTHILYYTIQRKGIQCRNHIIIVASGMFVKCEHFGDGTNHKYISSFLILYHRELKYHALLFMMNKKV